MKYIAKIFWLTPGIAVAAFLLYRISIKSPNGFREPPVNFYTFDTTEISGRLQYIGNPEHGDYFRTMEDTPGRYYHVQLVEFVPKLSLGLKYGANLGDSIVKHRFSNTLVLFHKNVAGYYKIVNP